MTLQDDVLRLVRTQPGITDAELAKRTGKRHQAVNQACRELAQAGRIERREGPGSIQNHPARLASAASSKTTPAPPMKPSPTPTTTATTTATLSRGLATPLTPGATAQLAEAERAGLDKISRSVDELREHLARHANPSMSDAKAWFTFVNRIRQIQGNISNDASLLAGILAREYLVTHANAAAYDAAAKAQGASGLDIDERALTGERIVGEIKTTVAHMATDLGAQQKTTFRKDFDKLRAADARAKYFFLTDRRTFNIVRKRYAKDLPGVTVVLLPDGDAFTVPPAG